MIDNSTGALTTLAPPTLVDESKPGFLEIGPRGNLWYGRKDVEVGALSVYNLGTETWTEIDGIESANGLEISQDGPVAYLHAIGESGDVLSIDTTALAVDREASTPDGGFGHKTISTPWFP